MTSTRRDLKNMATAGKIVSKYAVEMSSLFFIGGMFLVYLAAKSFGWPLLVGQLLYLVIFIKCFYFSYCLIKAFPLFFILVLFGVFLLGPIAMFFNSLNEPLVEKVALASGCLLIWGAFYFFCTTSKLEKIGWNVKN